MEADTLAAHTNSAIAFSGFNLEKTSCETTPLGSWPGGGGDGDGDGSGSGDGSGDNMRYSPSRSHKHTGKKTIRFTVFP